MIMDHMTSKTKFKKYKLEKLKNIMKKQKYKNYTHMNKNQLAEFLEYFDFDVLCYYEVAENIKNIVLNMNNMLRQNGYKFKYFYPTNISHIYNMKDQKLFFIHLYNNYIFVNDLILNNHINTKLSKNISLLLLNEIMQNRNIKIGILSNDKIKKISMQ